VATVGAIRDAFAGAATDPAGTLYTVGRDDGVRRWNALTGECTLHVDVKASVGVRLTM